MLISLFATRRPVTRTRRSILTTRSARSPREERLHAEASSALRQKGLIPDVIMSSPWKWAWQTATIMADEFSGKKKMRPIPAPSLAAEPDLAAIRADLGSMDNLECIALVGHEPWLSELTSLLLTGEANRLPIDFPKSGVVGIEAIPLDAGGGTLEFFLRPQVD